MLGSVCGQVAGRPTLRRRQQAGLGQGAEMFALAATVLAIGALALRAPVSEVAVVALAGGGREAESGRRHGRVGVDGLDAVELAVDRQRLDWRGWDRET